MNVPKDFFLVVKVKISLALLELQLLLMSDEFIMVVVDGISLDKIMLTS